MKNTLDNLNQWLNKLTTFSLPEWDSFPDLDLYMDQVMTYLERELAPLAVEGQEKMITTWMINNYVKGKLLPSTVQKKYSKEHLGYMFAICSIKQILSISDITLLFDFQRDTQDASELYNFFRKTQKEMINSIADETLEKVKPFLNNKKDISDKEAINYLHSFVLKLAIEAEVKKIIANKILYLISELDKTQKEELERKEKATQDLEIKKEKDKEKERDKEKEIKEKEKDKKKK